MSDQNTSSKPPVGNFVVNLNFKRRANADAPAMTGRISSPEEPEREYFFSAFEHPDKNGEAYWIGPVTKHASLRTALSAPPQQRGHDFVTIRLNGFKVYRENIDGTPNPAYARLSPEEQAAEDKKPSFWGSWTRDPDKDPVLKHAAWDREPNRYGPWASGNTQHPLSKEEAAALKAGTPVQADLIQSEPKPRRGKGKAEDAGRAA